MTGPAIRISNLATRFGEVWIHKGVDLDVERGELVSLVGGSGSGKTTLSAAWWSGCCCPMQEP
jgi:phospholipid/cholesterol/gamma-HCH transport system ATP-binding protein